MGYRHYLYNKDTKVNMGEYSYNNSYCLGKLYSGFHNFLSIISTWDENINYYVERYLEEDDFESIELLITNEEDFRNIYQQEDCESLSITDPVIIDRIREALKDDFEEAGESECIPEIMEYLENCTELYISAG